MNYYNERDPYAAQWLRNLVAQNLIPFGDVDERSIEDVQPGSLDGYTQCHFFAGIGGWPLAARLAGWPDDRELWTGSCPCQPFSVAGRGAGAADERHLWPHQFRLLRARRPAVWMGEQVASAIGHDWLDGVLADLEGEGYAGRAVVVPACAVDAPHRRDRVWICSVRDSVVGDGERARLEGYTGYGGRPAGWARADRPVAEAGGGSALANCAGDGRQQGFDAAEAARYGGEPAAEGGGALAHGLRGGRQPRHVAHDAQGLQCGGVDAAGPRASAWSDHAWIIGHDGKARRVPRAESGIHLLVDGLSPWMAGGSASGKTSSRAGALKGFGNAIVPQEAAEVIGAFMDCMP